MRNVKAQGSYTIPQGKDGAGNDVEFEYEFPVAENMAEAESICKDKKNTALAILNQVFKEDEGNNGREEAKRVNGHSSARVLSAEEKEENKAKRKVERDALSLLKAGNIDEAVRLLKSR